MYYVIYGVVLGSIFKHCRPSVAIALCLAMVCLQSVDSQNAWRYFRYKFTHAPTWPSSMSSALRQNLSTRYKAVILVSPSNGPKDWMPIAQFAATHGISTNAGYFARVSVKAEDQLVKDLADTVHSHTYNPAFLYVFNGDALWQEASEHPHGNDLIGVLDGFRILAPQFGTCLAVKMGW